MIKQLIGDLTFDRISLSQALTRAKIIAYKINNTQFKEWISFELNGYPEKSKLPTYRIVSCDIFVEIVDPFRGKYDVPFENTTQDEGALKNFYSEFLMQSISLLEESYSKEDIHKFGYFYFSESDVQKLRESSPQGLLIRNAKRRIQVSEIKHVIDTTKQRLLDTLLEFNEVFPNLENEYKDNIQNEAKAQTIINQTIYGDNANSNIAIGENITQSTENNAKLDNLIQELKKLGIDESDTNEVREIIINEKKENWGKKLMTWVGKMTTKAVEKGIELQVPVLIEKVSEFL